MKTFQTSLTLDVEVEYDMLPAEIGLPEQVDITAVNLTVVGKGGRHRKINLVDSLDESEIMRLEDETDTGE